MRVLLQRVSTASVVVENQTIARINTGLLALVAIVRTDTPELAQQLAQRLCRWSMFSDAQGRLTQSLKDTNAELLVVPQFTLAAVAHKGTRADFSAAMPAKTAQPLFQKLLEYLQSELGLDAIPTGVFGAHMTVQLTNDGPVSVVLDQN
ncbi:MAG: D-aminoacyl-tRNA deacylase [Gammaproteobacteria bacterium]